MWRRYGSFFVILASIKREDGELHRHFAADTAALRRIQGLLQGTDYRGGYLFGIGSWGLCRHQVFRLYGGVAARLSRFELEVLVLHCPQCDILVGGHSHPYFGQNAHKTDRFNIFRADKQVVGDMVGPYEVFYRVVRDSPVGKRSG